MSFRRFINIHSHAMPIDVDDNVFTLLNIHDANATLSIERQYSIGIHPWYINNYVKQIEAQMVCVSYPNVIAVGECGLDKTKGASMELQMKVFEMQIQIANLFKKPLIIHCVRAYPEVISMLKQAIVPVVFHGFNKRYSIARQVLDEGYYLSFGADLLKENSAAFNVFNDVPENRFFLETDDASINIRAVYKAASQIRRRPEDAIILQVQDNFKNVFNL